MELNKTLTYALVTIIILLSIGTFYFHEKEEWTYTNSFYYSTMILTTIGDSNFNIINDSTKLFISFYALFGISIMLYILGSVVGNFLFSHERDFAKLFSRWKLRKAAEKEEQNETKKKK